MQQTHWPFLEIKLNQNALDSDFLHFTFNNNKNCDFIGKITCEIILDNFYVRKNK
jgi:hypothetical protein